MSEHGGNPGKWEAQRIISDRNESTSGCVKCTKQEEIEQQEKILALHFPLFCCENPSEREAGKQKKKRVKQGGSQTIFYSISSLNKNIVNRSEVYLCTLKSGK